MTRQTTEQNAQRKELPLSPFLSIIYYNCKMQMWISLYRVHFPKTAKSKRFKIKCLVLLCFQNNRTYSLGFLLHIKDSAKGLHLDIN